MTPLEKRIGYGFRDAALLTEALTHPSVTHETQRQHFDNQRLEFLGDAVLQLVITERLFKSFPHEAEGRLTKLRARLVSREALHTHAAAIGLGQFIVMGRGEQSSGGRERPSVLADAFEALIGAMYLDSDLATVRDFILREAADEFAGLDDEPIDVNPKGQLQELLQAISSTSPVYEPISESGPEHEKTFVVEVSWENQVLGRGEGRSKKQAEAAAALDALQAKRWTRA